MRRPVSEIAIQILALFGAGVFLFFGLVSLLAPSLISELRQKGWNYSPTEDTRWGRLFQRFLGLVFASVGAFVLYVVVESLI